MDYLMILLIFESLQYLDCKPADKALRDALKIVVFDELVEVDA
jgi:hypothetical protein